LRGVEQIAERRIADPKDRERVLTLVREAMASFIERGQSLRRSGSVRRPKSPERSQPKELPTRRDDRSM
jgi:hypothetical protein